MGDAVPFQVYSTNGYMYIIFQTDDNVGSTGFRISYILEGAPTTTAHVTTSKPIIDNFHLQGHPHNLPDSNK